MLELPVHLILLLKKIKIKRQRKRRYERNDTALTTSEIKLMYLHMSIINMLQQCNFH